MYFNNFAKIGKDMAETVPQTDSFDNFVKRSYQEIELAIPHVDIVARIMQNQKPKLSCGLDTINNKVVKICSKELAEPMTIVIGKSIREASVPQQFKIARIIPL